MNQDSSALWIYAQCDDCQEKIKVRIDKKNDIQDLVESENPNHVYTLKKEIIGNKCFNLIKVILYLDEKYKVISSDALNGKLISKQDYETH